MSFGAFIQDVDLAESVWNFFCNSKAESTKRTYSSSTKHFSNFISCYAPLPAVHFIPDQLSLSGIILCFLIAYLYLRSTTNAASTIANYSSNLRTSWVKQGVLLTDFDICVYRDMQKGIKRFLPRTPDKLAAFLPHYHSVQHFIGAS